MIKKTHLAAALAALALSGQAWSATFVNGGFEDGNLNGWTGGGGTWFGSPAAPVDPANYIGGTPNNTIMTGGNDPITGAARVYGGSHSVRVNDSNNNYSVSTLTQSVANYTDNSIFFAWNAVLEASHGLADSDYFSLTLVDNTTQTTLVNRAYSSAGAIGGGAQGVTWTQYGSWYSSGWVVEQIDLAALGAVGHDFTLTLLASDCPYGGHAGYVYLDGFGAVNPPTGGTVPVPGGLALLCIGMLGLGLARRKH
ncbi:MAG: hypothetical protein ABS55_01625 [Lautropia sp. SCN 70-15]|nr:MAG: hypothetical protein ABS55_01625 [Lautropia sp. SCN 70-15]